MKVLRNLVFQLCLMSMPLLGIILWNSLGQQVSDFQNEFSYAYQNQETAPDSYISTCILPPLTAENNIPSGFDRDNNQKRFLNFKPFPAEIRAAIFHSPFLIQDIDRCPGISKIIFPFHDFW